jgi:hypothetical protein
LCAIADFTRLTLHGDLLRIGPMVTHEQLANALAGAPHLRGLAARRRGRRRTPASAE